MVQKELNDLTAKTEESAEKATGSGRSERLIGKLIWLLFPLTLSLAITRQSLWVDEGFTVWFASHKTIAGFFSALIGSPGHPGDPQMLLYLVYMWAWVKVFGESEWALRAANVPFAVLLIGAISWACRRLLKAPNLWILFCLSPFVWFYLNEARPYVALMAFSAISIVALLAYVMYPAEYRASAPWACLIALLFACGTQIMGVFLFPSLAIVAAATVLSDARLRDHFRQDWLRPALWFSPAFAALASFYIWVSTYGINKGHGQPGLSNVAYIVYEFLGLGGLGPPRGELRSSPYLYVFAPYWPWLLLGVTGLLASSCVFLRKRPSKFVWYLIGSLLIGVIIGMETSVVEHFQILGRHMSAFFPLLFLTLSLWSQTSTSSSRARTVAFVFLGIVWGVSDIRLVSLSRYRKDDYREAASIATARAKLVGEKILWAADPHTAHYYGVLVKDGHRTVEIGSDDLMDWQVNAEAVDGRNWTVEQSTKFLNQQRLPTLLVLSKSDLFDANDGWHSVIQQTGALELKRLAAFSIYEFQPRPSFADGEK
jgi:uncharacterized membrane protein